mmetsp:Transcript_16687/g.67311  ORF Transcript_16687/g.67311 Transcript_16687/m.67311 type:complete len:121 (-) Transcript_16687:831-1193(-)
MGCWFEATIARALADEPPPDAEGPTLEEDPSVARVEAFARSALASRDECHAETVQCVQRGQRSRGSHKTIIAGRTASRMRSACAISRSASGARASKRATPTRARRRRSSGAPGTPNASSL